MSDLILGTGGLPNNRVSNIVTRALEIGYRVIDTAATYMNDVEIRRGIVDSGIDPEDVVIISKFPEQLADREFEAVERVLTLLGRDRIDSWLVHGLATPQVNLEIWQRFISIKEQRLARHIGVSNYSQSEIASLYHHTGVMPEVNQIPLGPGQPSYSEVREYSSQGVQLIGHSIFHPWFRSRFDLDVLPPCNFTGSKHDCLIRWHSQKNHNIIVRSSNIEHLARN